MFILLALKESRTGGITQLLTVTVLFVFVLILTYFTTKFVAGYQKGQMNSRNIDVVETYKITPNKYLQIVLIGGKYFAIAISKDNVTLLGELNPDDIVTSTKGNNTNSMEFKYFFDKAKNLMPKKKGNDNEK